MEALDNMDPEDVDMLWRGITPIEAGEILTAMRVEDYPHLDKNERQRFYGEMKSLTKLIDPNEVVEVLSTEDFARRLSAALSG